MSPRRRATSPDPVPQEPSPNPETSESEVVISPTPRPIKPKLPEDVFARFEAGMRPQAADLYRRLKQGPVPIASDLPQVVVWMRGKGVRIVTRMTVEGSFYELEEAPAT